MGIAKLEDQIETLTRVAFTPTDNGGGPIVSVLLRLKRNLEQLKSGAVQPEEKSAQAQVQHDLDVLVELHDSLTSVYEISKLQQIIANLMHKLAVLAAQSNTSGA